LAAKAGRPNPLKKLANSRLELDYQVVGEPLGGCPLPEPGGRPSLFPVLAPVCTPVFVDTTR